MRDLMQFLTPADRLALARRCEEIGIPTEKAVRVSWLRVWVEEAAVHGEAGRIRLRTGCSQFAALQEAARVCRVEFSTHHQRMVRARRDALDRRNDPGEGRWRSSTAEDGNSDIRSLPDEDAA